MAELKVEEKPEPEVLDMRDLRIARSILAKAVTDVWSSKELDPVRENLKALGRRMRKPYSDVVTKTGYSTELELVAKELGLPKLMRSAWGTDLEEIEKP